MTLQAARQGFGPANGHIYPTQSTFLPLNHTQRQFSPEFNNRRWNLTQKHRLVSVCVNCRRNPDENEECPGEIRQNPTTGRRSVVITPLLAAGACFLRSVAARGDEITQETPVMVATEVNAAAVPQEAKVEETKAEVINSRIYDATVIGEPMAVGKDKSKVWEKLMNARIVYLGEAEQVPVRDDKVLELEILKNLKKRCVEAERKISLALEAFPCNLQEQLDQFMDGRIDGETLKSFVLHWPTQRWQEYEPLLSYCRDNNVQLVSCGTPLEILWTVQAQGIRGLSKADREKYAPPVGSGFISGFTSISRRPSIEMNSSSQSATFGPSSYLSVQARVVVDHTMSQNILQAVEDGGSTGMLVVVTGASHVTYGSRGTGLLARISNKMQKRNQVVVLLDPERQYIRREGEVPVADFLWYSAARPCSRNCFDRVEIARVMNAAGRRRDALPQDLQKGLDLGLISPEVLQSFFDLERYPLISELTHCFQGFRERLLADPKFLHKLAIEEAICITTTLLAQYERRKENFLEELDYVITDTTRGLVVDFFTVWLPAPTLSFPSFADEMPDKMDTLAGLLGTIPDNAFQKDLVGRDWNLSHRVASLVFGGLKLASIGFISGIGAVAASNMLFAVRRSLNPASATNPQNRRSPMLKTALISGFFLGTSANLRYQVIAGLVEQRISDQFSDQTLFVNLLSFVVRVVNSYWGGQQWIDLARFTGLQARATELPSYRTLSSPNHATLATHHSEDANADEISKK